MITITIKINKIYLNFRCIRSIWTFQDNSWSKFVVYYFLKNYSTRFLSTLANLNNNIQLKSIISSQIHSIEIPRKYSSKQLTTEEIIEYQGRTISLNLINSKFSMNYVIFVFLNNIKLNLINWLENFPSNKYIDHNIHNNPVKIESFSPNN